MGFDLERAIAFCLREGRSGLEEKRRGYRVVSPKWTIAPMKLALSTAIAQLSATPDNCDTKKVDGNSASSSNLRGTYELKAIVQSMHHSLRWAVAAE